MERVSEISRAAFVNGGNVFGWLKVALLIGAAFTIYLFTRKFVEFFTVGAGYNNPLKKGVDKVVTAATGRDETLGGWLNEMLDPNARKVADLTKPLAKKLQPTFVPADNYIGDFAVDANAGTYDEGTVRLQSLPPML